jgi:tectonic-1/3
MLIYFLLVIESFGLESNGILANTDTVACVCDLTEYSCDTYCCCDPDCISSVTTAWNAQGQCLSSTFTDWGVLFCYKSGGLFHLGTSVDIIDPLFKLLCVQYNNAPDWGMYYELILDGDYSIDVINSLVADNIWYPDNLYSPFVTVNQSTLAPGDRMRAHLNGWGMYDSSWILPVPDSDGSCIYTNYIEWLYSSSPQGCAITNNLNTICSSWLNTDTYAGIQISPDNSYSSISSNGISPNVNSTIKRTVSGNTIVSSSYKTSFSNCVCSNAVLEAHYTVYTNADQRTINKVNLDFVVEDIYSCGQATVPQVFSVKFYTTASPVSLSGKPGYIVGLPLLTGVLSGSTLSTNSAFTLYGRDDNGMCTNALNSHSPTVQYGHNLIFSCYLSLNLMSFGTTCNSDITQNTIFSSNTINSVGKFGNADSSNLDDWVTINYASPGSNQQTSSSTCVLPGILVYDIIYTQVGPNSNPQDKIIYVNKYYQTTTWVYRYSDSATLQKFLLSVVINYIPYQKYDDPYFFQLPSSSLVPDQVIYPLVQNSGMQLYLKIYLILIIFI